MSDDSEAQPKGVFVEDGSCGLVHWGLLGEWWCSPVTMSEEECAEAVLKKGTLPVKSLDLVRDRCFGGYPCANTSTRRHFYVSSGHYTYIDPEANGPLSEEERLAKWKEIIEENGEPGIGPFTHAGPRDA